MTAGAPVAAHWFADRQIGPALLRHGSSEQRSRYLPAITRGECFFAIGMSEPDSGSDLASIATAARPTGAGWRINGRKVWTSHAARAHYLLALVRTSPRDPQRRHAGLSQLIVDLAAPGVGIRPIRSLDGRCHSGSPRRPGRGATSTAASGTGPRRSSRSAARSCGQP